MAACFINFRLPMFCTGRHDPARHCRSTQAHARVVIPRGYDTGGSESGGARMAVKVAAAYLPSQHANETGSIACARGSRRLRSRRILITSCSAAMPEAKPGDTTLGFVGIGIMGLAMAHNLIKAGYSVVVWNRSSNKCAPLEAAGAQVAATPQEVAERCDIVFGMLADPEAALEVATGEAGIAKGMAPGKGYVDVSTVDAATSAAVAAAVRAAGALFLEAPVSGSKGPAEQGQLIFLTAGDEQLFKAAAGPLEVMGKASFFLGEVGAGANMKLVANMIMGAMMGAFCEGMALAEASGLQQSDLLEVLSLGAMANPMFALKGKALLARSYPPAFPLKHQQKDLRLALALGDTLGQPMPVAAAANEQFKAARAQGLGDADFAAVYEATLQEGRKGST